MPRGEKKERKRRNNPRRNSSRVSSYNVAALVKHPFDLVSSFAPAAPHRRGRRATKAQRVTIITATITATPSEGGNPRGGNRGPLPLSFLPSAVSEYHCHLTWYAEGNVWIQPIKNISSIGIITKYQFFFLLRRVVIGKCRSNEFLEELVDNIFLARI